MLFCHASRSISSLLRWQTYHHFPFAAYYDPSERFQDFGALRVINEDRVEPSEGFGTHGHSEFEIFSYIVSGELEHRDSLNNLEIMKRGEIQMSKPTSSSLYFGETANGI